MAEIEYSDSLVEIGRDTLLFRHYYFPFGSKAIRLDAIASVETLNPSLLSGKWRIHGTGDFRTWFPRDARRPHRDLIFLITLKNRWRRIGFTVEDSKKVQRIFDGRGLIRQAHEATAF